MRKTRGPLSTSKFTHMPQPAPRSRQAMLPNRRALNQLLKGDPVQRSIGNYAKLTPSGGSMPYADVPQVNPADPDMQVPTDE